MSNNQMTLSYDEVCVALHAIESWLDGPGGDWDPLDPEEAQMVRDAVQAGEVADKLRKAKQIMEATAEKKNRPELRLVKKPEDVN